MGDVVGLPPTDDLTDYLRSSARVRRIVLSSRRTVPLFVERAVRYELFERR